jgi:hypothetical protein
MRGMSLRAGSISSRPRVSGACLLALAMISLAGFSAAPAAAESCANAQFRSGPSERLPDCRAYEQVSPVEKDGQDAMTLTPLRPAQASPCGAGEPCTVAYMNVGAAFDGAQGNDFPNAYLAARSPAGWQTTALTPQTLQAPTNGKAEVAYAFSEDLSQTILHVPLQQLTASAPAGIYNLFLRQPGGAYSLVTASVPAEPPHSGCTLCFEEEDVPAFAGASSDFSHVIFEANDSLVPGAPGGEVENLYEEVAEHVRLVGILPDNTIPAEGATAGGGIRAVSERSHALAHAISQDGSRVLFEAAADSGAPDPQQKGKTELYDRIDDVSTVEVSAPALGAEPSDCETRERICDPGSAEFWTASDDGSLVYFTSKAALTKQSNTGAEEASGEEDAGNDLYRYDVETGALTDLTVDTKDANGAGVLGVVGSSEDGSYVYFVAEGGLGGDAESGKPNLYVWHGTAAGPGTVTYIATLRAPTSEEVKYIEGMRTSPEYHSDVADWTSRPTESQAYITPDGRHLAFMSVEPLTGYDNEDQVAGEADHEVFEYTAETGQLVCASCDAGDVRPLGSAFIGAKLGERVSTPFHQPRSLSDDGSRLFFSSPDPLVPGISGGNARVFEYEDGSVQLISGTESGGGAVFLDASASGDDVFFATRERLVPGDTDELVDVYDARVGGGLVEPPALMPCQAGACREALTSSPSFSVPASASFAGAGNLAPAAPVKATREQLLSRALALCRKLRSSKRRSTCTEVARRRYAPKVKRARHGAVPERSRPRR